jgi:hypothetical protein
MPTLDEARRRADNRCMNTTAKTTKASDYKRGAKCAKREMAMENWDAEMARLYLAAIDEGNRAHGVDADDGDDFGRGFNDAVRAFANA